MLDSDILAQLELLAELGEFDLPLGTEEAIDMWRRWLYNGPKDPDMYDWRDTINATNLVMEQIRNYLQVTENYLPF